MEFETAEWTDEIPWTLRKGAVWVEKNGEPVWHLAFAVFFGDDHIAIGLDNNLSRLSFLVEAANEKQNSGGFYPPERK